ncbi:MAG TPA: aldo/keto reductase [Anaerolineales bacterium]
MGLALPKVGFGTWGIGGESLPDRNRDAASLKALSSALELGYTHFDAAEMYAGGHCEELIGRAIREAHADRMTLFLTSKALPENLTEDKVRQACERSLKRLGTEYLDLYLIHWPNPGIELQQTFRGCNSLVRAGKVRHVGVSNFDLDLLREAQRLSETPLLTNQVPYSVAERAYVKNGVVKYCTSNGILVTAYSPLEQVALKYAARLLELATSRSVTPQQIAIAWLCSQDGVITIPMSSDPEHQRQNLEAADLVLSLAELEALK